MVLFVVIWLFVVVVSGKEDDVFLCRLVCKLFCLSDFVFELLGVVRGNGVEVVVVVEDCGRICWFCIVNEDFGVLS